MGFTVVHKGGTSAREYRAYARLLSRELLNRGITPDNVPRVRDEGSGNGWLYVWDSETEAADFAKALKRETRDSGWSVQSVKSKPSHGPLRPLVISVGRQGDGWAFGLEPLSQRAIETRNPGSCRRPRVFIASETRDDFLESPDELRDLARQVLVILTGLRGNQLKSFGSFQLYDPVEQKELLPPIPLDELNGESSASRTSSSDIAGE